MALALALIGFSLSAAWIFMCGTQLACALLFPADALAALIAPWPALAPADAALALALGAGACAHSLARCWALLQAGVPTRPAGARPPVSPHVLHA